MNWIKFSSFWRGIWKDFSLERTFNNGIATIRKSIKLDKSDVNPTLFVSMILGQCMGNLGMHKCTLNDVTFWELFLEISWSSCFSYQNTPADIKWSKDELGSEKRRKNFNHFLSILDPSSFVNQENSFQNFDKKK